MTAIAFYAGAIAFAAGLMAVGAGVHVLMDWLEDRRPDPFARALRALRAISEEEGT